MIILNWIWYIVALYVIGDLHLSLGVKKPMDIFSGWENHTEKLVSNWESNVEDGDTVVLAGDTSWGMTLGEALPDFQLIHSLKGRKLILKGNHCYWWTSAKKITGFWASHGLGTLKLLHNNAYEVESFAVCGSRGWIFESGAPHDDKIINREKCRIEASLKAAEGMCGEKLLFLHYPPVFMGQELTVFIGLMREYGIKRCFYGHIHGAEHKKALSGLYKGVEFSLISADYLNFSPKRIEI